MLYSRYAHAAALCAGKDVLEVACGPGMGLGLLASQARIVVGADYTESLLRKAHTYYRDTVPLVRLDAHALPFKDSRFDVIVLFEAIYYLRDPDLFLSDCHRVLKPGGTLLVCSANKEWSGFNPSPYSTQYFSARELQELLLESQFDCQILGAFPGTASTASQKLVARIRKQAVRLNLIPKTMRGKEALKRLFYGRLVDLGEAVSEGMAPVEPLVTIPSWESSSRYKVLYALAERRPRKALPSELPGTFSALQSGIRVTEEPSEQSSPGRILNNVRE